MKFKVKSVIAYMIIACMLMTFMPVLAEEPVLSDFSTDIALNAKATDVSGNLTFQIVIRDNYPALYGYVWEKGEYTYDEDETKKGLYHTADGTYVSGTATSYFSAGSEYKQVKSPFINDFVFKGTFDGVEYEMPISSYGKTSSHDSFQFVVDPSAYPELSDDAATGQWSTSANDEYTQSERTALWSNVKIVEKATGKELAAKPNFGMYTPFRIDFCGIEAIAEAFPEYFYVGRKVTAEGTLAAYAKGYNGALPTSDATATRLSALSTVANFKVNYNGTDIVLPINLRTSGSSTIYAVVKPAEFNAVTGGSFTNSTLKAEAANITNIRLTSDNTFPAGTVFVSAMDVLAANGLTGSFTEGGGNSSVTFIKGNTQEIKYAFAVPEAGEYDVYCMTWDSNDSTKRGGNVYVNGVKQDFYSACTLGTSVMQPYWEPTGTITLSSDINKLVVPVQLENATNGYGRFGGIAFVPADKEFTMDETESASLANAWTGMSDIINTGSLLSTAAKLTTSAPDYDSTEFTVTVDGTEYNVKAGTGAFEAENYYDAQGNFITGATVTDALSTAGLTKRNASGQVNAVLVDGKNVYPDRTLVYDGMAITTVDGGSVTKANFSPVLRNDVISTYGETSAQAQGIGMNLSSNFRTGTATATYYAKLFPFVTMNSAETTTADASNLIGCRVQGYFTAADIATSADVMQHANTISAGITSMKKGGKILFLGDPIVKLAASMNNIFTGNEGDRVATMSKSSYLNTLAVKSAEDPTVAVHNPFQYYNQRATSGYTLYDNLGEVFISNTSATNDVWANEIKEGKWQLLTTGTVPCQVMIVDANGAVKSVLKDQIVTGISPLVINLEAGEKAYVWEYAPYNGTVTTAGIWQMKPLCDVLTY